MTSERTQSSLKDRPKSVRLWIMQTINATCLRKDLYNILDAIVKRGEPVEVVLSGQPAVVLSRSPGLPPGRRKPLIDLDRIGTFCERHAIRGFSLFGSILTAEFDEESDVDVLIDLGSRQSSFGEDCDMIEELETMFSRRVDLVPASALSSMNEHRRTSIANTAREVYRAAA